MPAPGARILDRDGPDPAGLRVCFFHPYFRDGGIERMMIVLARELQARGAISEVVTLGATAHFAGLAKGVLKITDLGASRTVFALPGLARHLRVHRPDVVISAQTYANVIAVLANLIAGRPSRLMITERVAVSRERRDLSSALGMGRMKNRVLLVLMRIFYRFSDVIAGNSQGTADDLAGILRYPGRKVEVLYNPAFDPSVLDKACEEVDHPFFKDSLVPVLVGIGRLALQKDFSTLLRAFAKVRERAPCRLLILGEGEQRASLEAQIRMLGLEHDVSLPGFDANPYRFLKRARMFVFSSQYEGLGNALIEAVALGVPVVSTDCLSGPREILLDGRGGTLVPVGDDNALADAILEYLAHPDRAMAMLAEARAGLDRFESRAVANRYLSALWGLRNS